MHHNYKERVKRKELSATDAVNQLVAQAQSNGTYPAVLHTPTFRWLNERAKREPKQAKLVAAPAPKAVEPEAPAPKKRAVRKKAVASAA